MPLYLSINIFKCCRCSDKGASVRIRALTILANILEKNGDVKATMLALISRSVRRIQARGSHGSTPSSCHMNTISLQTENTYSTWNEETNLSGILSRFNFNILTAKCWHNFDFLRQKCSGIFKFDRVSN